MVSKDKSKREYGYKEVDGDRDREIKKVHGGRKKKRKVKKQHLKS